METTSKHKSTVPKWVMERVLYAGSSVPDPVFVILSILAVPAFLYTGYGTLYMGWAPFDLSPKRIDSYIFGTIYALVCLGVAIRASIEIYRFCAYQYAYWILKSIWKKATGEAWRKDWEGTQHVYLVLQSMAQGVASNPEPMKERFYAARDAAAALRATGGQLYRIRDFVRGADTN